MRSERNYARWRAAGCLQFVKFFVRKTHQRAFLIAFLRVDGYAEIQGDFHVDCEGLKLALVLRADPAAEGERLFRVGLRQQDGEFVAADTKRKIGSAERPAQGGGRHLQNLIALQMPVTVIHFLQLMKIEDDDCELMPVALCAIEFLIEVLVEEAAILEPGDRIGCGVDLEFLELFIFNEDLARADFRSRKAHPRSLS